MAKRIRRKRAIGRRHPQISANEMEREVKVLRERLEKLEGVLTWAITAAVLAHSDHTVPRLPAPPPAPYRPRVSSVTGYHPKFMRGWWL